MEGRKHFITEATKCDLYIRFSLGNEGLVVRGNHKQLFDQLRNAHWYYLDFYCSQPGTTSASTNSLSGIPIAFEDFCEEMIWYIPEWKHIRHKWRPLYDIWRQQTSKAVRCGAIILDNTFSYVLLVRGFFRDGYQFPAGKKDNDGEPYETCAIREVAEETGFDISKLIRPSLFFERKVLNCLRRYYIITGVHPDSTLLCPSSRNEIKVILWMKIDKIPEDNESARNFGHVPRDFFLCMPWAKQLKAFSRCLREGVLLFKALQLSEAASDEAGDTGDEQQDDTNKHKSGCIERQDKKCDKLSNNRSSRQSNGKNEIDCAGKSPHSTNSYSNDMKNARSNSSFGDKPKARRRYERRKHRITNFSSSSALSDSQMEDERLFMRVSNKDSSRRRSYNKVKDSSSSKTSSLSCSDSGYSDQSDQTSSSSSSSNQRKEHTISSNEVLNDSLMNKAVMALKQISLPSK